MEPGIHFLIQCIKFLIRVNCYELKDITVCMCVFQVWFLCKEEPSDWYSGLAFTLGDCDWLLFLLLWSRTSEPHWRPPAVAGHRSGRHHPFLAGQCCRDSSYATDLCASTISGHWQWLGTFLCWFSDSRTWSPMIQFHEHWFILEINLTSLPHKQMPNQD